MQELDGVQWDKGGNPYASLDSYEGTKTVMADWIKNDPAGQAFAETFNTNASIEKMAEVLELHGMVVSSANLTWVAQMLTDSGQLTTPEQEAAASRTAEPDVPRDRNGKALTPSQLEWREFAIWANDPKTSSAMIAERRRTSSSFNKFYVESLKREFQSVGDATEMLDGSYRPTSTRGRL
jgi:hypothetical protein